MLLQLLDPRPRASQVTGNALWRLGFRPFYLLAAGFAWLAIPYWLLQLQGWQPVTSGLSGLAWHAHEMLFGYAVAVIAGFLLTAVPNWTGQPTPEGARLAALALQWLLARVLLPFAPLWLSAAIDLSFLPTLAWIISGCLQRAGNRRNRFIPMLLLAMAALNGLFYLAESGVLKINPLQPILATLGLITVLEVIIAGRILPMFTRNAIPGCRQVSTPWLERWIAPLTLLVMLANLAPVTSGWLAAANLLLAALHLKRWLGWGPLACWKKPLLWILHLGYLWIVIGLVLASLAACGLVSWVAVHHAFGIGALGCLTLGMITRTALGHTGRLLQTGWLEGLAYASMLLASGCRLTPLLNTQTENVLSWLWCAGFFWCAAFTLYLVRYLPILIKPRMDGKPG